MRPREATHHIDVMIELAGGLDLEWLDYLRALGKRVVFQACGHPYANLAEPSVFGRDAYFSRAQRCDEVWLLPMFAHLLPLMVTLHRCPVYVMPYIWSSQFLAQRVRTVQAEGHAFGFDGGSLHRPWRAAVFEPNVSVVKSGLLPMLICDAAYRQAADSLSCVHLLNTVQFAEHPTFAHLCTGLALSVAGRLALEQRHDFAGFMATRGVDLVVSHQWTNMQNYLYLDALHGGYPLVHNSPWLQQAGQGYYYSGFDIDHGAAQIATARVQHRADDRDQASRRQAFLAGLEPCGPDNLRAYGQQMALLDPRHRKGAA